MEDSIEATSNYRRLLPSPYGDAVEVIGSLYKKAKWDNAFGVNERQSTGRTLPSDGDRFIAGKEKNKPGVGKKGRLRTVKKAKPSAIYPVRKNGSLLFETLVGRTAAFSDFISDIPPCFFNL